MAERKYLIAGSILSADLLSLGDDVGAALEAGVDIIHFDVMDFHFVPNLTFGPAFLKALRARYPKAVFDVHLMVAPVTEQIVEAFAEAGASWISFHPEGCVHQERMLSHIRDLGCKAGIVLNPGTAPEFLRYLWDKLDFVLVMTVNPGFGGQKALEPCLIKVAEIKQMAKAAGVTPLIEVDGGVKSENIAHMADCGAQVFVAGSAFFGAKDKRAALQALRAPLGESL
ncbi:MAG: ribulose-phosphate 3-epimerase [Succinivibrio sp.]|nr:ribulose-phosphate 3-epimerase [Succinivibrio sp.]